MPIAGAQLYHEPVYVGGSRVIILAGRQCRQSGCHIVCRCHAVDRRVEASMKT